jgi:hypothetical protein
MEVESSVLLRICASRDLFTHFAQFLSLREKLRVTNLSKFFTSNVEKYRQELFIGGPILATCSTVHYDMEWMGESDVEHLFHLKFIFATRSNLDQERIRIVLRNDEVWRYDIICIQSVYRKLFLSYCVCLLHVSIYFLLFYCN